MKIFWAWQSDNDQITGRYFVRDALIAAVKQLKQPEDIEDPVERENKASLSVDYDRKDVPGSPDLAKLIFEKITRSRVFVADVTPVSRLPGIGEDGQPSEKRNVNPNVAIELGFALHVLTDANVLMVLNTNYGDRRFLPFDLAHKAGPICYQLAPDATKQVRASESATLQSKFVEFLKPYLKSISGAVPARSRSPVNPSTTSAAVYFRRGEELGALGQPEDNYICTYRGDSGFYLRLQPINFPEKPFKIADLYDAIGRGDLWPLWRQRTGLFCTNDYGAMVFEPQNPRTGGDLKALTQIFTNGELWGLAPWLLMDNQYGKYIPSKAVEETYQKVLYRYCKFLTEGLAIAPPFHLIAGAVGVLNYDIVVSDYDERYKIREKEFSVQATLNACSAKAIGTAVVAVMDELFAVAGYRRQGN
jgi:hypothetical protein